MDNELKELIREGVARTNPDPILSDDVVAAHRMPIPISRMTAICQAAPKGARVTQRGEWLLVLKGGPA
jgi:hypothetical protein